MAAMYERMIRRHCAGTTLDLGCGAVPLFDLYKALGIREVVCIDWPNTAHGVMYVDVFANLAQALPLRDACADTVLLTDVLEHVSAPDQLMAESARLLRPGGKIVIGVPFLYPIHEQPHDYHRYTEYRLRQLCTDHGLAVLELEPYGGAIDVLVDILSKLTQRVPVVRTAMAAIAASVGLFGVQVRARTAHKFPLGYVLVATKAAAPR